QLALERVVRVGVIGQRNRLDRWEQLVPDQVEHRLHILHAAGDRDHGVLFGEDEAILSERAVAAVGAMAAAPELVAVALVPVVLGVAAVRSLPRRGRLAPGLGHELFPLPLPLLEVELAEPGDVLGADAEPVAAEADTLRADAPGRVLDAQRLEQAR